MNDEKKNLEFLLEFINNFGADQDDVLDKLEIELSQLDLIKSIFNMLSNDYELIIKNLESDLLNEKISFKEFKFGKEIADTLSLKNKTKNLELELKIKYLSGKIEAYKNFITNLKLKYDTGAERLKKIKNFESLEIDGLKGTNIKLAQRPIGIHPGNPLAIRKNKVLNNKNDINENINEIIEQEENYENENLNNVLNQLNSLLDESDDKIKIVNKELINLNIAPIEKEEKEVKKRGRKK